MKCLKKVVPAALLALAVTGCGGNSSPTGPSVPTEPQPTPTATATPDPSGSPVPTATATPTAQPTATATATPTGSPRPTPTATPTAPPPTPTATPTSTPAPSISLGPVVPFPKDVQVGGCPKPWTVKAHGHAGDKVSFFLYQATMVEVKGVCTETECYVSYAPPAGGGWNPADEAVNVMVAVGGRPNPYPNNGDGVWTLSPLNTGRTIPGTTTCPK